MTTRPLPIAVLISGGGTTLRNLLQQVRDGQLDVDIRLVVSSNPQAAGLKYAAEAGIDRLVVGRKSCGTAEAFREAIFEPCRRAGAELVVMAGFLHLLPIPPDFENRVMNIHPSLIPAFCGRGYYGRRVHQAVLDYGVKVTGCTVHFVDNRYDHGPVILQRVVPVRDQDTADTLAARVFQQECLAYPEAIRLYAAGKLHVAGRRVLMGADAKVRR